MRPRESYARFVVVTIGLTLAILASFQIYLFREPERIAADEEHDKSAMVSEGKAIFNSFCTVCHGKQGEGVDGPALNDKQFLAETTDQRMFSLISSGVPGTKMPAWNQVHGGPFTDQQVTQLVAFIRNWEPTAPDRRAEALKGDPSKGLVIFSSTCFVCHGENGQGTDRAPVLNDLTKLAKFDDAWYIDTIANGRPAKGMPTWGTVLSPSQIRDLVALLRAWQRGETVNLPGLAQQLGDAARALDRGDSAAAQRVLEDAAKVAAGDQLKMINDSLAALKKGDLAAAKKAVLEAEQLK